MPPPLVTRQPVPLLPHAEHVPQQAAAPSGVSFGDLQRLCLEINGLPAHEMDAGLTHLLMRLGTLLNVQRVECSLVGQNTSGQLVTHLRQTWATADQPQHGGFVQTLVRTLPLKGCAYFMFTLKRAAATPEFDAMTRDWLMCALASLGRWLEWLALSHGVPSPLGPMSAQQRKVLLCLLSGLTEKQIASKLKLNVHTTHQCVTVIYRRFGVRSRPSLTAHWLAGITSTTAC